MRLEVCSHEGGVVNKVFLTDKDITESATGEASRIMVGEDWAVRLERTRLLSLLSGDSLLGYYGLAVY